MLSARSIRFFQIDAVNGQHIVGSSFHFCCSGITHIRDQNHKKNRQQNQLRKKHDGKISNKEPFFIGIRLRSFILYPTYFPSKKINIDSILHRYFFQLLNECGEFFLPSSAASLHWGARRHRQGLAGLMRQYLKQ